MTSNRQPKPAEIKDLKAHFAEQALHWKRPHLKPLEEQISKSAELLKLKDKTLPALDIHGITTNYWT